MSMTFSFNVNPFGDHDNPILFGTMRVNSAGEVHQYRVDIRTEDGWNTSFMHGEVPKRIPDGTRRSGHRNFLHLLRDILNDMDLEKLGKDYVNIFAEIKEVYPNVPRTSDYPNNE